MAPGDALSARVAVLESRVIAVEAEVSSQRKAMHELRNSIAVSQLAVLEAQGAVKLLRWLVPLCVSAGVAAGRWAR